MDKFESILKKADINQKWLEWFVGFIDGDGSFRLIKEVINNPIKGNSYVKLKLGLQIGLSDIELPLLVSIQEHLGCIGKIYTYKNKRSGSESTFVVTKQLELQFLVLYIFDKVPLISSNPKDRYAQFRKAVMLNKLRVETLEDFSLLKLETFKSLEKNYPSIDTYIYTDSFVNWFIGFINAEGCFSIDRFNNNTLVFSIENTDKNALEFIKKRFNFSSNVNTRPSRSDRRKPTYTLAISSRKDVNNLVSILEDSRYAKLMGNKLNQFNNWLTYKPILI